MKTTDLNGQDTTWTYDALCRPRRLSTPGGDYTEWYYWNIGTPWAESVETRTPGPHIDSYISSMSQFDGFGRILTVLSSGPHEGNGDDTIRIDKRYDARGNLMQESLPYFIKDRNPTTAIYTQYRVDALDRQVLKTLADGQTYRTEYGANFGADAFDFTWVAVYDPTPRKITATRSDAFGRVRAIEQWGTSSRADTVLSWDPADQLVAVTDPHPATQGAAGATWSYRYDTLGRRIWARDPDLGETSFVYDLAGRLTQQKDARKSNIFFGYDALNRPISKRVQLVTEPEAGGAVTQYAYDEAVPGYLNKGQLVRQWNEFGRLCADYDLAGRVVRQRWTVWEGATPDRSIKCDAVTEPTRTFTAWTEYGAAGRVLGRMYPENSVVGKYGSTGSPFEYDGAGRLSRMPGLVSLTYDAAGRPLKARYGSGATTVSTYDINRGWLKTRYTGVGPATNQGRLYADYTYNAATGLISRAWISNSNQEEDWSYTYDGLFRLTKAAQTVSGTTRVVDFAYNLAGNMTSQTGLGTYVYPAPRRTGRTRRPAWAGSH